MNERERSIMIGTILGDAFLQKTGQKNARLRLEHSSKQKEYIFWKWRELKRYLQDVPKYIERFNPVWKKQYAYYRCQSHASRELGKLQAMFYNEHRKQIPITIKKILKPLALATWFMDDGYYNRRDRAADIYLSPFLDEDIRRLQDMFAENFDLHPRLLKKTHGLNFRFSAAETKKLCSIIAPHIIKSMRYKIGEEPRID